MNSTTMMSYFICRCGALTTDRSHFTSPSSALHVRIDEIIAPLTLTDVDLRVMRDFASQFAQDFRIHENEMESLRILNGYRRGLQLTREEWREDDARMRLVVYALVSAGLAASLLVWWGLR